MSKKTSKKTKSPQPAWQQEDTQYSIQVKKYGYAVPSREFIMKTLTEGVPQTLEQLLELWQIHVLNEEEALAHRLYAMVRDGQLVCNRRGGFGVAQRMALIRGKIVGHAEGHGFLHPDDGSEQFFLSPREMRAVMHGDIVLARTDGTDPRGRKNASIVEVLERGNQQVVGRYYEESGIGFVKPENRRLHHELIIPPEVRNGACSGQIVVAQISVPPTSRSLPVGRISEVLGEHMAPGMEVQIAIINHNLPYEWPRAVDQEATQFPATVTETSIDPAATLVDLRKLPLITIDGITARDFDDAVFCEKRGSNYRLWVAIAHVSAYVTPGSALDDEAQKRGTSVYFPDRVIPMLPEVLSNGLCSLNPDVDRLCLTCEMTLDSSGKVLRSRFVEGIMRSHARMTYDTVAAMLAGDAALREEYAALVPHIDCLHELYRVLRAAREARGAIDFETQDTVIEYDPQHKIDRIVPTERNDAHKLIEECMILANVVASRFLERHKMPTLYRVHQGPTEERLMRLRSFLGELGLGLGGGDQPTSIDYAKALERAQAQNRPDLNLVQTVMLRSLRQAVYTADNAGHFGLALESYVHFTSPIRRYPDLLVHRAICHILRGGKAKDFLYSKERMTELGQHCSMTERRADDATREAIEWLKCEYMQNKVGETYWGSVTGVTSFGLFVSLEALFVEGLVHVTSLKNDYYRFDPVGHRLQGEHSGKVYRLGDRLQIRVARVSLEDRKIDFELLDTPVQGKTSKGKGKKSLPQEAKQAPPRAKKSQAKPTEKKATAKKSTSSETKSNKPRRPKRS